jgi:hypothetical protein
MFSHALRCGELVCFMVRERLTVNTDVYHNRLGGNQYRGIIYHTKQNTVHLPSASARISKGQRYQGLLRKKVGCSFQLAKKGISCRSKEK